MRIFGIPIQSEKAVNPMSTIAMLTKMVNLLRDLMPLFQEVFRHLFTQVEYMIN